jgi:hypothetical protein
MGSAGSEPGKSQGCSTACPVPVTLLVQSKLSAEIVERRWQFDWSRTEFELERSADVDDVGVGETADFADRPAVEQYE